MRRIGVLYFANPRGRAGEIGQVFAKALENLGWKQGRNLQIDTRSADADAGKLGPLAKELVDLKPDVLLASNTPAALALQQATQTIPIVFVAVGDPIGSGLVNNLARPGGNITGFTNMEPSVAGKRVELLKAIVPGLTRIVAMFHEPTIFAASGQRAFNEAARRNALEPVLAPVRSTSGHHPRHHGARHQSDQRDSASTANLFWVTWITIATWSFRCAPNIAFPQFMCFAFLPLRAASSRMETI